MILICGHGKDDRILGNSDKDIVLDTLNDELLTGKVVHALLCQSAKKLGFDAIKKGAKAYIGYKEDFIAFYDNSKSVSKPFEDEIASLFLKPAMVAPKSLLKGNSPEDAIVDARRAYNKSIKEALNSDIQSDADQFVNWLVWDRDNLISCK